MTGTTYDLDTFLADLSQERGLHGPHRNGDDSAEETYLQAERDARNEDDAAEGEPQTAAFDDADLFYQFALAGSAIFTLESVQTGTRFTYKITKADYNPKYPTRPWFVGVLSGQDNTGDYRYAGLIDEANMQFRPGGRALSPTAPSVQAFQLFWRNIRTFINAKGPNGWPLYWIYHAGYCGRCGRLLTTPESVRSGIGPVCAGKL